MPDPSKGRRCDTAFTTLQRATPEERRRQQEQKQILSVQRMTAAARSAAPVIPWRTSTFRFAVGVSLVGILVLE